MVLSLLAEGPYEINPRSTHVSSFSDSRIRYNHQNIFKKKKGNEKLKNDGDILIAVQSILELLISSAAAVDDGI